MLASSDAWQALVGTMTEGMMFIDESNKVSMISKAKLNNGNCRQPSSVLNLANIQPLAEYGVIWHQEQQGCSIVGADYSTIVLADSTTSRDTAYLTRGASLFNFSSVQFDLWPYTNSSNSSDEQNHLLYFIK